MGNIFFNPVRFVDPSSDIGITVPGLSENITFDPTKIATTGFTPQGLAPFISVPKKIARTITTDQPASRTIEEIVKGFVPGGRYGAKVLRSVQSGPVKGKRDRTVYKQGTKEKVLRLAGLMPTEYEARQAKMEATRRATEWFYERQHAAIDAIIARDRRKVNRILRQVKERHPEVFGHFIKGITTARVRNEVMMKGMTREERFYWNNKLRKRIKPDYTVFGS